MQSDSAAPPASESSLGEASPHSLDELFSRDPFDFTARDRGQIVAEFRRLRSTWDAAEAAGKAAPKAKKGSSAATPKGPAQAIDMSLLGLLGDDGSGT